MERKNSLRDGFGRVLGAKRYLLLVYLLNLGIAAAMAWAVAGAIESSLGSSATGERMVEGFDPLWYEGFETEARGLARTFEPGVAGVGGVFRGIDAFVSGRFVRENRGVLAAAGFYLLVWIFLGAGLVHRFRRPRPEGSFFQQCARFFPRFLVLGILAGALYWLLYARALPWLEGWVRGETQEVIDERVVFLYTLAKYGALVAGLCAVDFLFTFARVITVVRNRVLVFLTPFEALGFVLRHPVRTVALAFALGILWSGLVAAYWGFDYLAPTASDATAAAILVALGAGQIFILGRIFLKCLFLAASTALYERCKEGGLVAREVEGAAPEPPAPIPLAPGGAAQP